MTVTPPNLLQELKQKFLSTECPLVGCMRQNAWSARTRWQDYRGKAILMALGKMQHHHSDLCGDYDTYAYGDYLLQYRGGHKKVWWEHDITKLLAVTQIYVGCILIQEVDGELHQHYIPAPSQEEAKHLLLALRERWSSLERIAKNTQRAYMCRYCPVKARCDALDVEQGQTDDWPDHYKAG